MEIVKNVIFVIKKYSAGNIHDHLNLLPVSRDLHFKSRYIPKVFALLLSFLSEKYVLLFLGIEKHGLAF